MIDFPDSPQLNDEFSASGRTWRWNNLAWVDVTPPVVTALFAVAALAGGRNLNDLGVDPDVHSVMAGVPFAIATEEGLVEYPGGDVVGDDAVGPGVYQYDDSTSTWVHYSLAEGSIVVAAVPIADGEVTGVRQLMIGRYYADLDGDVGGTQPSGVVFTVAASNTAGSGVSGPGTTTIGHVAVWATTDGTELADGGELGSAAAAAAEDFAAADHDHDGAYAAADHNHDGAYDPAGTAAGLVTPQNGNLVVGTMVLGGI